ncbi:MAG: lipoprotein [Ruminococcus sp.]|nr:lipoprotein [Ruminococcus sp.]
MKKSYMILLAICLTFVVSGCADDTRTELTEPFLSKISSTRIEINDAGAFIISSKPA